MFRGGLSWCRMGVDLKQPKWSFVQDGIRAGDWVVYRTSGKDSEGKGWRVFHSYWTQEVEKESFQGFWAHVRWGTIGPLLKWYRSTNSHTRDFSLIDPSLSSIWRVIDILKFVPSMNKELGFTRESKGKGILLVILSWMEYPKNSLVTPCSILYVFESRTVYHIWILIITYNGPL